MSTVEKEIPIFNKCGCPLNFAITIPPQGEKGAVQDRITLLPGINNLSESRFNYLKEHRQFSGATEAESITIGEAAIKESKSKKDRDNTVFDNSGEMLRLQVAMEKEKQKNEENANRIYQLEQTILELSGKAVKK